MSKWSESSADVDAYISQFDSETQKLLKKLRKIVREAAPDATETINYGIPTFTLGGNLVHFAAFKHHIGFYPAPSAIDRFQKELAKYRGSKGSVQFPLDKPIPLGLVARMVRFRARENRERAGLVPRKKRTSDKAK